MDALGEALSESIELSIVRGAGERITLMLPADAPA
jgi:hypothetical protein